MGCLSACVERRGGIGACVERRGGMSVSVSLICTISTHPYLRVLPREVMWIDVSQPIDYSVYSNMEWFVN